jgi:hypothetical protein
VERALTIVLVLLGLCVTGCGDSSDRSGSSADASARTLITALPGNSFRVGRYVINDVFHFTPGSPSNLSDVEAALGRASICSGEFNEATARWPKLGISGHFMTLGAFSDAAGRQITDGSATGCNHRDQIQVDSLTVTGSDWHTRQGLKIGDPLERLLDLYPRGIQDGAVWWLHTVRSPFGDRRQVPDMTAKVSDDRVESITVNIGAQGD